MSHARWLVFGASGLVGGELVRHLREERRPVEGAARHRLGDATHVVDLERSADVERAIDALEPDVVVVASAWPYVDGCEREPERSRLSNVDTMTHVAKALDHLGSAATIVFYSTDHVFDGNKPAPYVESDPVAPLSVYAKHKREVETMLLARGRALIVRTAWVFGAEVRGKNFVYRVISAARAGETLKLPEAQAGCPTSARWLANATREWVDQGLEGVVHATGTECLTKAEWARTIASALRLSLAVEEVAWAEAGQVAPRPERVALASERHALVHPPLVETLMDLSGSVGGPVEEGEKPHLG